MTEKSIAIIPTCGYQPARKYSAKAIRWLSWMMHRDNVNIRHAGNGGEVCINKYWVDRYHKATGIYEFYGCIWYDCETCFLSHEAFHPIRKSVTFEQVHLYTKERQRCLFEKGYCIVSRLQDKRGNETIRDGSGHCRSPETQTCLIQREDHRRSSDVLRATRRRNSLQRRLFALPVGVEVRSLPRGTFPDHHRRLHTRTYERTKD